MEIKPGMKILISEDNVYTVTDVEYESEEIGAKIWRVRAEAKDHPVFHLSEAEYAYMRADYLESLMKPLLEWWEEGYVSADNVQEVYEMWEKVKEAISE